MIAHAKIAVILSCGRRIYFLQMDSEQPAAGLRVTILLRLDLKRHHRGF